MTIITPSRSYVNDVHDAHDDVTSHNIHHDRHDDDDAWTCPQSCTHTQ